MRLFVEGKTPCAVPCIVNMVDGMVVPKHGATGSFVLIAKEDGSVGFAHSECVLHWKKQRGRTAHIFEVAVRVG